MVYFSTQGKYLFPYKGDHFTNKGDNYSLDNKLYLPFSQPTAEKLCDIHIPSVSLRTVMLHYFSLQL